MADVAERLYYTSPELEFRAVITDIRLDSRDDGGQIWQVALDRTAFYPEGGGQPWDTGTLTAIAKSGATLNVAVERVEEDEHGEVWHYVRKPLLAGTEITAFVDSERRVDHEQQHSGQHLLSAVFLREINAKTVSFHLGAESSTIDLALADGKSSLELDEIARVEAAANQIVIEGRPLTSHWVDREVAEAMLKRGDLRKLPDRAGPMRIVQMQGIEFNACGGTHVSSTGGIGSITVRRIEKVRQGWRVEFCCGLRAVRAARRDYEALAGVAGALSVGASDVPSRVQTLLQEAKNAGKERRALMDALASAETTSLLSDNESAVIAYVFAERDLDFAKRVATGISGVGRTAVIGATRGAEGYVVLARASAFAIHAGNLLKDVLANAGARGGGSADMGQGICSAEAVPGLVEALSNLARSQS